MRLRSKEMTRPASLRGFRSSRPRFLVQGILCAAAMLVTTPARAKLRAVASTSDVGAVLQAIGGARIELVTIARGSMDPHYLEAKPSYIVSLRKADLLAYNGLQLEVGWLPLLLDGARNRQIVWGAPGHVAMSRGIEILEVPQGSLSRAQGDIHPEGNPHYTLHPRNVLHMAGTALEALVRLDPEGAAEYERNHAAFVAALEAAIPRWEERMRPHRGREVVCQHKQWEYLLAWLGLVPVDYVENKPGIPPSPRHLDEIETLLRERRIPLLLGATFANTEPLERIAERTGTKLLVVPAAVGAIPGVETPVALFDHLVGKLAQALGEGK